MPVFSSKRAWFVFEYIHSYGICVYKDELVEDAPALYGAAETHSNTRTHRPSAPRCYCLLSKFPYFTVHLNVLYTLLGMVFFCILLHTHKVLFFISFLTLRNHILFFFSFSSIYWLFFLSFLFSCIRAWPSDSDQSRNVQWRGQRPVVGFRPRAQAPARLLSRPSCARQFTIAYWGNVKYNRRVCLFVCACARDEGVSLVFAQELKRLLASSMCPSIHDCTLK